MNRLRTHIARRAALAPSSLIPLPSLSTSTAKVSPIQVSLVRLFSSEVTDQSADVNIGVPPSSSSGEGVERTSKYPELDDPRFKVSPDHQPLQSFLDSAMHGEGLEIASTVAEFYATTTKDAPEVDLSDKDEEDASRWFMRRDAFTDEVKKMQREQRRAIKKESKYIPTFDERYTEAAALYSSHPVDKLDMSDLGKYAHTPTDTIPLQYRHRLKHEMEVTGGYIMVRRPHFEIVNFISQCLRNPSGGRARRNFMTQELQPLPNVLTVCGYRGTGKTSTLALAAMSCESRGLVLPVCAEYIMNEKEGLIRPNARREGIFDQPLFTRRWFEELALANAEKLSQIPLQGDYSTVPWQKPTSVMFELPPEGANPTDFLPFPNPNQVPMPTDVPKDLYELVCLGAWRGDLASELMYSFVWELQRQDRIPVFVFFDSVNLLHQGSPFRHPETLAPIPGHNLSFADAISQFLTHSPRLGAVVAAISHNGALTTARDVLSRGSTVIRVPVYTNFELQMSLDHYRMSNHVLDFIPLETFRWIQGITGNVPKDVRHFVAAM